jgi:formate dehydrogenase iron-sulfur subunit
MEMSGYGILIDTTMCIGCYACEAADAERWGEPVPEQHTLSSVQRTAVLQVDDTYLPRLCMHCTDPTCVSVCPVGALKKTDTGAVVYDADKCMGCRYCLQACPFEVPKYEWDKAVPKVTKCDMCHDRVEKGRKPACVEACPTGARTFGKLEDLIKEAQKRMFENPGKYYPSIYGIREAGGTSILYISDRAFEKLGLKTNIPGRPMPSFTWDILSKIPHYVFWGSTLLTGIWWITNRRTEVRAFEMKLKEMESRKDGGDHEH